MTFGEFFKNKRIEQGLTLRAFCSKHGYDPGNISRLERGRLAAPQSRELLEKYAQALAIRKGADQWYEFFDLAAAESGQIPPEIMADEEVVEKLPILFRTLRGQRVPNEKLEELIRMIRES